MKKIIALLLAASMLVASATGCGSKDTSTGSNSNNSEQTTENNDSALTEEELKKEAQDFAEEFLTAYDENDYVALSEMASESVIKNMGVYEGKATMLRRTLLTDLGVEEVLDEGALAAAEDMANRIVDLQVQGYEITSVEAEDSVVIVKANILHGPDSDAIADINLDTAFAELADTYTEDNMDELAKIYNEGGDEALENALMNGIYPLLFEKIGDELETIDLILYEASLSVKPLEDGSYTITSISEVATSTTTK